MSMQKQQQQQQLMHTTKAQANAARGHAPRERERVEGARGIARSCLLPLRAWCGVHGYYKWEQVVTGEIHLQGRWIS